MRLERLFFLVKILADYWLVFGTNGNIQLPKERIVFMKSSEAHIILDNSLVRLNVMQNQLTKIANQQGLTHSQNDDLEVVEELKKTIESSQSLSALEVQFIQEDVNQLWEFYEKGMAFHEYCCKRKS